MGPGRLHCSLLANELVLAGEIDAVDDVLESLGRSGELALLGLVQRHGDAADNAVATDDGRHGDGQIGQAVLAHHERGDGQHGLLVTHDSGADTLNGHGNAVVGGVLLLDDGVGGVLDVLGDTLLGSLSGTPSTWALDQATNSESPCSPMT